MATVLIHNDEPFAVPVGTFALSPSNEGYTLNYSADGVHLDAWDVPTPAGHNEVITNAPCGLKYKLVGNQSDVILQY